MAVSSSAMRIFPVAIKLCSPTSKESDGRGQDQSLAQPGASRILSVPSIERGIVRGKSERVSTRPRPLAHTLRTHGHQDSERGAAGKGFAFYGSTVIPDDLGHQSKPQASSGRF